MLAGGDGPTERDRQRCRRVKDVGASDCQQRLLAIRCAMRKKDVDVNKITAIATKVPDEI